MRIEGCVRGPLPAILDEGTWLPTRSMKNGMVFVMDTTGHGFKVLVNQCRSRQHFAHVLEGYFGNSHKGRVLRDFIAGGAYDLYTTEQTQLEAYRWSGVPSGTRVVMTIDFEQPRNAGEYKCPQCNARNKQRKVNTHGWVECAGCPGWFRITDGDEERLNVDHSSMPDLAGNGIHMDLLLTFDLRQESVPSPAQPAWRAVDPTQRGRPVARTPEPQKLKSVRNPYPSDRDTWTLDPNAVVNPSSSPELQSETFPWWYGKPEFFQPSPARQAAQQCFVVILSYQNIIKSLISSGP
ncbi:hypothetical protein M413DRAFT_380175 [Hebeloma cylindrosporum]|uniref:Ubiquitin-like domain-containing protein n=1 Tax=Hebeloma cylindrosporum TaxID=76867 RepID=A0A0C3BU79_HEBCY|nr:hypothetical protein M413DRAFT_380175 [Hebeloma cylindrosporum h7]